MLTHIIRTKTGKIMASIILGIGLSCLFKKVCKGRNCVIYKAPEPTLFNNNTYSHNEKCYTYIPITTKCHQNDNKNIQ